jgi:hypothetical protein
MMYRIERYNGQPSRMVETWDEAVQVAEGWLGQELHQGASDYTVDWADENGDRKYGYATDFWRDEANANQEMSVPADVVIVSVS